MTSIFKIVVYDTWNITSIKVSFYLLQYDHENKQIIHFFRIPHNPYQISLSLLMKVFFQRQCVSFKDNFKNTFHHFPQSRTKYFEQRKQTKLDKARKVWYLLLRVFWLLLTKFNFSKGSTALDHYLHPNLRFCNIS